MRLFSIASGSSGNALFVGNEDTRLLVDAGISGKRVIAGLAQIGVELCDVDAILITHEHSDHICGLGVLLRKCEIPVYATQGTIDYMLDNNKLGKVNTALFHAIEPDVEFTIRSIRVNASAVCHDAADPVCYSFLDASGKISIATDLGCYDEYLLNKLYGSDAILIESNHDVAMLESNPRYSYPLKQRILGNYGHLSNERSGELMTQLVESYQSKYIILGHLSKENNVPDCALINMLNYMKRAGCDVDAMHIEVAKRDTYSVDIVI
jgi:phosphoribosyl 1,2-cyclic phosphodiesterase